MSHRLSFVARAGALTLALTLVLLGLMWAADTSKPVVGATEVITVPDPLTGEPMELTVEVEAASSADAAAYVYWECARRYSTGLDYILNGTYQLGECGRSQGLGGNSVSSVRDRNGPLCVYYGTTLAGCGGKGVSLSVSNRSGYQAIAKTQPIGS